MHIEKNIRKLHNLHHIQYLHCNQIHIYSLNSRDNNPSFKSPPLIPFTSVSVPPDVLLNRLQVLTVPDLPDELKDLCKALIHKEKQCSIAARCGVTDAAIRKRIKKLRAILLENEEIKNFFENL